MLAKIYKELQTRSNGSQTGAAVPLLLAAVQKLLEYAENSQDMDLVRSVCPSDLLPKIQFPSAWSSLSQMLAFQESFGLALPRSCLEWVICCESDVPLVEQILENCWNDAVDRGTSAVLFDKILHFCTKLTRPRATEFFLRKGIDPSEPIGDERLSPLHLAVQSETDPLFRVEIITTLIKYGANLEALNYEKETPLFYAARLNLLSHVQLLLSNHTPNIFSSSKRCSILAVCEKPDVGIAALLPANVVNEEIINSTQLPFLLHSYRTRSQSLGQVLSARTDWDLLVRHPLTKKSFLQHVADQHVEADLEALFEYIPKRAPQLVWSFLPILAAGMSMTPPSPCSKRNLTSLLHFAKLQTPSEFDIDNREHSRFQRTLLHEVCAGASGEHITEVLASGASVSSLDSAMCTPLILLSAAAAPLCVRELVSKSKETGVLWKRDISNKDALTYYKEKRVPSLLKEFAAAAGIEVEDPASSYAPVSSFPSLAGGFTFGTVAGRSPSARPTVSLFQFHGSVPISEAATTVAQPSVADVERLLLVQPLKPSPSTTSSSVATGFAFLQNTTPRNFQSLPPLEGAEPGQGSKKAVAKEHQ